MEIHQRTIRVPERSPALRKLMRMKSEMINERKCDISSNTVTFHRIQDCDMYKSCNIITHNVVQRRISEPITTNIISRVERVKSVPTTNAKEWGSVRGPRRIPKNEKLFDSLRRQEARTSTLSNHSNIESKVVKKLTRSESAKSVPATSTFLKERLYQNNNLEEVI